MTNEEPRRVRPDEVLPPDGKSIQSRELVKDAILMMPNIVKLVGRLLKDPRVPRRAKITLGLAAAYVMSPIDLIPEVIPVLGWADDVILVMFALDSLIDRAGPDIVEEHWDGPGDLLGLVRDVVSVSRNIVPKRLGQIIDRLSG
ncbi:MAG TPA: YkvA family protein [Acidimicrobiia bacterium]|nr:YkvA family protein [Acidimicrobiia bacterium]